MREFLQSLHKDLKVLKDVDFYEYFYKDCQFQKS